MVLRVLASCGMADVFHVPHDYPEFELEDGTRPAHGWYWWYVCEDGCPDTYPSGPFASSMEALADWDRDAAYEPVEE